MRNFFVSNKKQESQALLFMLAEAPAATIPATVALRAVLAEAGAAAFPAQAAPLVVHAEA